MGLEAAATIDQLNPDWPLGADYVREGDNHLRVVKGAIKGTFPNLVGATSITALMVNQLPEAGFTAFLTELLKHVVPTGAVITWSGSIGTIPDGWALCDGSGGTPDLRSKFILGAGTVAVGVTQGALPTATDGSGVSGGTALTVTQIPAHTHGGVPLLTADVDRGNLSGSSFSIDDTGNTASTGGGEAHTHTTPDHAHVQSLPPYYALAYIMKTSVFTMPEL